MLKGSNMNPHGLLSCKLHWQRFGAVWVACLLAATMGMTFSTRIAAAAEAPHAQASHSEIEAKLGIKIVGLRRSSAGYMLDFRYRVLDAAKAASLLDRKISPHLLDEASGAQLGVPDAPKVGQLRPTSRNGVIPGRSYYILFANPGRYLNAGSKVTLVAGEIQIRNLTVE